MSSQRIEIGAMLLFPVLASTISFLFNLNGLASIILFYGVPALYLSLAYRGYVRKAAIFSVVGGIPFMTVISYIVHLKNVWYVDSMFPPLLGYIIIEDLVWAVFWIYFTILFYEAFIHHRVEHKLWHPHMRYFIIIVFALLGIFAFLLSTYSSLLAIPYFYLYMGLTVMLLPVIFEFAYHKRVFMTFIGTGVYFFYFHLIYEVTGLKLGWWSFPSTEFIGIVNVLGVVFPLEELFFWIMLGGISVLSYFEIFDDAQRV